MKNKMLHISYKNCTICPFSIDSTSKRFLMGAFDGSGSPIKDSLLFRDTPGVTSQIGFIPRSSVAEKRSLERVIYMGVLFPYFGHFILESLARAWFAKANPDIPIAWSVRNSDAGTNGDFYRQWQKDLLALLGVRNRPVFVSENHRFEEVIFPETGYRIQNHIHPDHRDFLGVVDYRPESGRYTWLSRARLPANGNRSSHLLDERLSAKGWDIVYPEQLSIAEQIGTISKSERVAGEQGSALHMLLFLKNAGRLRVDIFARHPDRPIEMQNQNFVTIGQSMSLDQNIHICGFERVIRRHKSKMEKIGENSFRYLTRLDVSSDTLLRNGPNTGLAIMNTNVQASPTSFRLRELAKCINAKNYLEVGVADGKTFLNVDFPLKHAVDTKFRFDVRPFETSGTSFFEMTSDNFFTHFADHDVAYDLIFLDGLHTFEQTFRDFCCSQSHSHKDTVWLIDDVHPNDIFSAHPVQKQAYKYRAQHGRKGRAWHGDVFKLIFAIHDFFPNLDFCTIDDKNPQTIVIRRPRKEPSPPMFGNLEAISRMTYYDFLEHRGLLNMCDDEAALKWLSANSP